MDNFGFRLECYKLPEMLRYLSWALLNGLERNLSSPISEKKKLRKIKKSGKIKLFNIRPANFV